MTMSDSEIVERIRDTLSAWADEPVGEPPVDLFTVRRQTRAGRPAVVWLVAAIAAVTIAIVAAVVLNRPSEPANVVRIGPAPTTTTEIPVGHVWGVRGLTITEDAVWVTSRLDKELYRVDPSTNRVVDTFAIPENIEGVVAAGGWLWLSRYEPNELVRVDPATGAITGRIGFDSQPNPATDGNRLWVVAERDGASRAVEIDPATAEIVREIVVDQPPGFATLDGDDLWFASFGTSNVVRVDLGSGSVATTIDVVNEPRDVVVVGGAVWAAVNKPGVGAPGSVVRIDPDAGTVTASVATRGWIHSLAADGDSLWATNFDDGTMSVIDTAGAELVATTPIGDRPGGVAFGHGSIWVAPHRRPALVRIDRTLPLEAAAEPDVARVVDVSAGTVFIRCSGTGSPTVVLEAGTGEDIGSWATAEARLSRRTRVCTYDRVGVADESQAGQAGPASTVAADLATALAAIDAHAPYIVVGESLGAMYAETFAASNPESVVGLVLLDPIAPDFYDRIRPLLTEGDLARMDEDLREFPELRWLDETEAEVSAISGFGNLPLVVVSSDPIVAGAPNAAVAELVTTTRRERAERSTRGTFVDVDGVLTPADVVDAVDALLD